MYSSEYPYSYRHRSVNSPGPQQKIQKMRDLAAEQLTTYKNSQEAKDGNVLVSSVGAPVGLHGAVLTVGPRGPMLMQDVQFQDELAHFDRERIPERVAHAKGAGAHGYLEVTHDITKYSKAVLFNQVGKKTPLFVRFSTVGGESGSADTARDPRGFAVKFYTEDGIYDLVGNNTPIFFIRDPILFPSFIHTQKRNPVTHLKDADMFWDFVTLRPETVHQVMILFSDRGIPDGYRHMNGYGSHTFKLVNSKGEAVYCKFHLKTNQGIKNIQPSKAAQLAGTDPDYAIRDLYNAIQKGEYPSWNFYIQVMTFEQAETFEWNPFDVTKVWPHCQHPLIPVGKLVLNRNPGNYFAEVEQSAFSPAHFVPGVEPSPDKMLHGRLFSYNDTHYHRLGPNHKQLPINCPRNVKVLNTHRDGPHNFDNKHGTPNYQPNSFGGPTEKVSALESRFSCSGDVERYNTVDDDNFSQPRLFWKQVLDEPHRERLIQNVADNLCQAAPFLQQRAVKMFCQVDACLAHGLEAALEKRVETFTRV